MSPATITAQGLNPKPQAVDPMLQVLNAKLEALQSPLQASNTAPPAADPTPQASDLKSQPSCPEPQARREQVKNPRILHSFSTVDDFIFRHEQGTLIEMSNEETVLKRFNEERVKFGSWVIAPIPGTQTAFHKSWLVLVKAPKAGDGTFFPNLTDRFTIDVEATIHRPEGMFTLIHLPTSRICNPYDDPDMEVNDFAKRCAAFKVDVPRSWKDEEGMNVELDLMAEFQVSSAIDDLKSLELPKDSAQHITIQFDVNSITFDAELAALRYLTEEKRLESRRPSEKSLLAFQTILNFASVPKTYTNLHEIFPHIHNPLDRSNRLPRYLTDKFRSQPTDHLAAHEGLQRIANGLYFVNGCPGAGKTEWNMNLAALIQARKPQHSKRRHSPVLFLVDINATVDSAADRYHNLCKAAGLRLRIIRMHGWPYELRNSGKLQPEGNKGQTGDSAADFTKKFLTTVNLAQHTNLQRSPDKAPTLDEAAWEYYERHKHHCDQFVGLDRLLKRMDAGEVFSAEDWKSLRNRISTLYRAVLAQTDFIATTPAAVYGSFPSFFKPDVIFVDEAPHARELTTLIPIAYFDPFAWIFTGDVKQTRPFVKGGYREEMRREGLQYNPFTGQLRLSTMARADTAGVIDSKLLVNQRAHGNLQRLPSKMFYEDRMSSGHIGAKKFPQSTRHLQRYLEQLDGRQGLTETRVVVELEGSEETRQGASFWNPCHQRWVLGQVQVLLADSQFKSLEGGPGIIMIQTPYGTSSRQYQEQVKQWSPEWQDRVQVCTVDKAQGNQADVVFLDMVRTSGAGFMNDPQRLNVAITRARQAEVIVMHKEMSFRYFKGRKIRSEFVSQIWDDAEEGKRLVKLCGVPSVLGQM